MSEEPVATIPTDTSSLSTVESLLPYFPTDNAKLQYISYRACGFTTTEAVTLTGITDKIRGRWIRDDPEFRHLETHINDLRQTVGAHYTMAEFLRNFRLALEKDYRVLSRALSEERGDIGVGGEPVQLSTADRAYLLKIRSLYTPEQLAKVKQALTGQADGGVTQVNFTQLILQIAREGS